ncbi:hypothetical protein STEG23_001965, partial [Scotinomys teguina]
MPVLGWLHPGKVAARIRNGPQEVSLVCCVSVRACRCSDSAPQHHSHPNFTEKARQADEPHLRTEPLAIGARKFSQASVSEFNEELGEWSFDESIGLLNLWLVSSKLVQRLTYLKSPVNGPVKYSGESGGQGECGPKKAEDIATKQMCSTSRHLHKSADFYPLVEQRLKPPGKVK